MSFSSSDFFATVFFWIAFAFSAGPFWTALMASATTTSFKTIYANYFLYLIFGWLPLIAFIATIVAQIGSLGVQVDLALHLIGTVVIFGMAWMIFQSEPGKVGGFDFNWKKMSLLSWTNPKVWLLIPVGFLSANITSSVPLNIALYGLVGVPFFLVGVFVWGMLGRLGARISFKHVNRFNALLMALFGFYLAFSGWTLFNKAF